MDEHALFAALSRTLTDNGLLPDVVLVMVDRDRPEHILDVRRVPASFLLAHLAADALQTATGEPEHGEETCQGDDGLYRWLLG
jgi:hypothetical protein